MAHFGVVILSEASRDRLNYIFTSLSFLLSFLSLILVLNSVYLTFVISPNLHSEKAIIGLIFTIMGMLAMQLTIYYLAGIFVYRKCHVQSYKKNSRYLLRIWLFSGYSSILNILIIGAMSVGVSNHIIRSMHYSMLRGMELYLKDCTWKRIIDNLQYKLQCCGSKAYTDWHKIAWISCNQIVSCSNIVQENCKINGDRVYCPAVPWSCCALNNPKQCLHDPLQQSKFSDDWSKSTAESVNNIGCIEILREPVENGFLLFILFSYILTILQILLSIISQYLYTSYRNAVILGDPFGASPGWLIGYGPYALPNCSSVSHTAMKTSNVRNKRCCSRCSDSWG